MPIKISQMTSASSLDGTELVPVVQAGGNVRTTVAALFNVFGGFLQLGVGAVARTFLSKNQDVVSVFDFMSVAEITAVLAKTGLTDVTVAVQRAEDTATAAGKMLHFPAGLYLITNQISRSNGSQWIGEHRNQSNTSGFVNGTQINFSPASAKSLFVPTAPVAAFRVGFCTVGFYLKGNSTNATGNSIYAWDVDGLNKCRFSDLTITGFRTGIRCNTTINNRFEFVKIVDTYVASVLYDGGICTTDVWDQPYFGNSPIGMDTTPGNAHVGIRLHHPIFEGITTYGMNIVRECYGFMVLNAYVEDSPNAGGATNAMFRVGYDGTTLAGAPQLIVEGGFYGGRNAGGAGSLFDIDFTDGVILGGFHVTRFTNGIKTSANTQTNQVVSKDWTASSVSNLITDDTKVTGRFPIGAFNSSTRNQQTDRVASDNYTAPGAACTGAITTSSNWKISKTGNQVTLVLTSVTGVASASPSFSYGDVIPAKYRPSAAIAQACPIRDSTPQTVSGWAEVSSAGVITVYKDGSRSTNFTAGNTCGIASATTVSLTWTV